MKKIISVVLGMITYSYATTANAVTGSDSTTTEMDSAAYAEQVNKLDSIIQALDYQTGKVILLDNLATVTVPAGFGFLNGKDAQFILTDIWGNPRDPDILGMLVPMNVNMREAESWAIVYSYEEDGHVKDDDAEDIKYDELLEQMQKDIIANNPSRVQQGFPSMELVGWAKTPFYDKATHKLHWAKEIKFSTDSIHTLNYNIRMLGRKGVLVMNVVSGMDNIQTVEKNMNAILASTNFNAGNNYDNFDSDVDKVAEYGIGGLIAGGILLKTGLLAKIGILLLKLWKIIAIAVVGVFGAIRKKLFRKKSTPTDSNDVKKIE